MKKPPEGSVAYVRSRILQYRDEVGVMEFAFDVNAFGGPWAVQIPREIVDGRRLEDAKDAVAAFAKAQGIEVKFYR